MSKGYWTSKDLCHRFRCSARTLSRWMARKKTPLPKPKMNPSGSHNLWAIEDVVEWENRCSQSTEEQAA